MPTHARARAILESVAKRQILITYQELANALQILPPHSIHRVTEALERLMEEDAAADRPFIAALAISKARGAASSSCSYAAVAITRSIFRKGANFTVLWLSRWHPPTSYSSSALSNGGISFGGV